MSAITVSVDFEGSGIADPETIRKSGQDNRLALISSILKGLAGNALTRLSPPAIITGGTKATQTVTFSTAAAANADTVTIGGRVYTFRTTPAAVDDVLRGATFGESALNLANAINGTPGNYFAGTAKNTMVSASVSAGVVTLKSLFPGTIGNLITLAKSGTNIAVGAAALAGGTNGVAI